MLEGSDPVWEGDDARPVEPGMHVAGRLSGAGQSRFYFTGALEGAVQTTCRRCLVDVTQAVSGEVQLLFAESGLDEADEDDVVVIPAGARDLDLRPTLREEWLLAVPAFALCCEDCLGLCATCGADRNTGACTCAPTTDPRWAGLRAVRGTDT